MKKRLLIISIVAALLIFSLGGCGKKKAPAIDENSTQAVTEENATSSETAASEETKADSEAKQEEAAATENEELANAVNVKNAEELLMAIKPGANIVLSAGTYNLSGVIRDKSKVEKNEYLSLSFASYDNELVVRNVDDMTITGPADGKAEIVIEDPYAAVMAFEWCKNVKLSNVTMGHTAQKGYCTGSVVKIVNCVDMAFSKDDLYGCGTYGIEADRCQGVRVDDTIIRECSYGIVSMRFCSDTEFNNCILKECEYLDLLDLRCCSVTFNKCEFKDNKTKYDFVARNSKSSVFFNGCHFDEVETERLNEMSDDCSALVFDDKCTFDGHNLKSVVTVSSAKELFDAIRPGATIYIEPGEYNLTECAKAIYEERGLVWDRTHEYVKFSEVFDGVEVTLNNVDNLTICGLGGSSADVSLIVDPRYAAVFYLKNCENVSFINLTAGHSDRGNCVGDVISIEGGSGFVFSKVDLFGCGVNGIGAYENFRNVYVYDSIIRDCEYGPLNICDGTGEFYVINTDMYGSNGGGYYDIPAEGLYFLRCSFGEKETNKFAFMDNATIWDCEYSEITEYPDYEYDDIEYYGDLGYEDYNLEMDYCPEFDKSKMKVIPFDYYAIEDTYFKGYQIEDSATGDVTVLKGEEADPSMFAEIAFYPDSFANIYGVADIEGPYTWECDSSYSGVLVSADGKQSGKFSLYAAPSENEDSVVWMLLSIGTKTIWLFL